MGQVMDGNCFIESESFIIRRTACADISKYVFGNFTTFKAEFLQPAPPLFAQLALLPGCEGYSSAVAL